VTWRIRSICSHISVSEPKQRGDGRGLVADVDVRVHERVCVGVPFHLWKGRWFPFWWVLGVGWRIRGAAPSGWPALRNPHVKKLRSQFLNMRIFFLNRWRKKYFFLETESEFQEMMRKSLFLQETGTRAQMNFFEKNLFSLTKRFFVRVLTPMYMCPQTWTARQPRRCSPDYSDCVCEHDLVNNILYMSLYLR
jgi:hypothetical protein